MTRKLGSFNRRKWRVKRDKGRKHKVRERAGEKEHSMQDKKRWMVWMCKGNMLQSRVMKQNNKCENSRTQ